MVDNKILIISSDFPPLAGTNTQRIQSFVRYLPFYQWKSIVVTRDVDDLPIIDSSELAWMFDDTEIIRISSPDIFKWRTRRNGVKPYDVKKRKHTESKVSGLENSFKGKKSNVFLRLISQVIHSFFRLFLYHPDAEMPWAFNAARNSIKVIKKQNIQVFLTSAPTYSTLVAGLLIKYKTDRKWVADFRDLWVGRPGREVKNRFSGFVDNFLERAVIRKADKIILASPAWQAIFEQRYGALVKDKICVITNGYDLSKLEGVLDNQSAPSDVFRIALTGSMHKSESPAPFLEALGALYVEDKSLLEGVQIRLTGYPGEEKGHLDSLIQQFGLQGKVVFVGVKPHRECLLEQKQADVLLLCQSLGHKNTICAKSYEYMAAQKPIFALVSLDGMVANLLKQCGCATIVNYADVKMISKQLKQILITRHVVIRPDLEYISQFDRKALTGKLVYELNNLVTNNNR